MEKNVLRTPDAVAVADPPNRAKITVGEAERLTYAELKRASERLAGGLLEIGLRKDDVLMVQLPNVVELVAVYLAAAKIGAVVSPLPVQYRKHELRQVMGLTEPRVLRHGPATSVTSISQRWSERFSPSFPASRESSASERTYPKGVRDWRT